MWPARLRDIAGKLRLVQAVSKGYECMSYLHVRIWRVLRGGSAQCW
jgi:hypothetical protein